MTEIETNTPTPDRIIAAGAGVVSGVISAVTLDPFMQVIEELPWAPQEIWGFLTTFGVSAGLAFGLLGGAFLMLRKGVGAVSAGVFLATSMVGIAAAVYVAILFFDNQVENYILPYLAASPVGALIVAGPLAFLARFERPWRKLVLAVALPTLWAVAVAVAMAALGSDDATDIPWLAALYIGWQALFLMIFAGARRPTAQG